jgi:hypothetical protein
MLLELVHAVTRDMQTLAGRATAQERGLEHAAALALAVRACGTVVHLPSPLKRQPW